MQIDSSVLAVLVDAANYGISQREMDAEDFKNDPDMGEALNEAKRDVEDWEKALTEVREAFERS